jgi:sulfite reductase alpha subunit-like flavoprotein
MRDFEKKPKILHQMEAFEVEQTETSEPIEESEDSIDKPKTKIMILFGSETGQSESFAQNLSRQLSRWFTVEVDALDNSNFQEWTKRGEWNVIIVTSTFGQGEPPANAVKFSEWLGTLKKGDLQR